MSTSPVPADGRSIAQARLIFVNGLGFEGWLDRLVTAAKSKGEVFTLGKGVKARKDEEGEIRHACRTYANAKVYVEAIRSADGR